LHDGGGVRIDYIITALLGGVRDKLLDIESASAVGFGSAQPTGLLFFQLPYGGTATPTNSDFIYAAKY
jgi:hypothetical protein